MLVSGHKSDDGPNRLRPLPMIAKRHKLRIAIRIFVDCLIAARHVFILLFLFVAVSAVTGMVLLHDQFQLLYELFWRWILPELDRFHERCVELVAHHMNSFHFHIGIAQT